jgi:hypothetical protein
MSNIQAAYKIIINEIQVLKQNGISFLWNELDLSSILISDLIVINLSSIKIKKPIFFQIFKLYIYAFRQKSKYKNKLKINIKEENILIFFNSLNQLENLKPVLNELKKNKFDIHVISSKLELLKLLPKDISSTELIIGFSNFVKPFNYNIQNNSIVYSINYFFPKINYLYKKFNQILSAQKYKYILIGNDNTSEGKLLAYISERNGIRTGCIQHGSMNRVNPLYGLSIINDMFVYGDKPASELVYLGINKNKIIVSGWPIQSTFKKSLSSIKKKNNLTLKSDILVCLSGVGHSVNINLHKKIIGFIKRLQDELKLSIIIKLHPKDQKNYYNELDKMKTQILDNETLKIRNASLLDLFVQTKCTFTVASTAALESLLAETPVVTLDLNNTFQKIDFIKDGLTYHATSYEEMKINYLKIINSPEHDFLNVLKEKLEKYYFNYFNDDNNPSLLIANKIALHIRKGNPPLE